MRSKNTGELTMSHLCLLGVATLTLTSASFAGSDTNADLQARLEAAEARISELSAATNANWLNDARADEIRGLVHDVLADADSRASLQGSSSTAGYNNGFTIGNADGSMQMKINGLLQVRWIWDDVDNRVDSMGAAIDNSEWGFETTRGLLNFSGTIASDYGFNIRHDVGSAVGVDTWAYGTVDMGDWDFRAGNMKIGMTREWLINAEFQQAVERSYLGDSWGNSDGIAADFGSDNVNLSVMLSNGPRSTTLTADSNESSWNLTGRLEYLMDGNWDDFDQFTSAPGSDGGMLFGVGLNHWDNGNVDVAGASNSGNDLAIDFQWNLDGANVYVSWVRWDSALTSANPTNLVAQIGYYLTDQCECFARYQDFDPDFAGLDSVNVFGVGFNYYMSGQNAKWTTDFNWADDGMLGDTVTGWQTSTATNDQFMIRSQLQFYF